MPSFKEEKYTNGAMILSITIFIASLKHHIFIIISLIICLVICVHSVYEFHNSTFSVSWEVVDSKVRKETFLQNYPWARLPTYERDKEGELKWEKYSLTLHTRILWSVHLFSITLRLEIKIRSKHKPEVKGLCDHSCQYLLKARTTRIPILKLSHLTSPWNTVSTRFPNYYFCWLHVTLTVITWHI